MFQYTDKNHFEFGYLPNRKYSVRQSNEEIFYTKFGVAQQDCQNWREANKLAALKIQQNLPGPYWLLLSGGTDSEICLRAFLEAGVSLNVATLRLANNGNDHDLKYVEKIKNQLGIKVHYFDLDPFEFLRSQDFQNICNTSRNISPIYAFHMWLGSQLPGTPIIAQGDVHLRKQDDGTWSYVEHERLCALYRYFIFYDKPAVPGFFQYLPEQTLSYLKYNPYLKKLVNNEIEGKLGHRSSKNIMALQFYPEVELRTKYTGFEQIESLIDIYRQQLRKKFSNDNQFWHRNVYQMIMDLQGH